MQQAAELSTYVTILIASGSHLPNTEPLVRLSMLAEVFFPEEHSPSIDHASQASQCSVGDYDQLSIETSTNVNYALVG